jgi:sortase A
MWSRFQTILGRVLIVTGALLFACWGYVMLNQFLFQRAASHIAQQQMSNARQARQDSSQPHTRIAVVGHGEIIGRLAIPRLKLEVVVLEGSDSRILDVAAGHVEGTALPGSIGNIAIAAHRDTFFRPLRDIRRDDIISLRTAAGDFAYQVESTEVVDPTDIEALHQTADAELTLVTCYPFHYIGPAPKRFIVHARQRS